eukprot:NODE_3_length_80033_cov_0.932970.p71 type:complete len:114 gc:universal NODE_3_length_80033_cov_0.932970:76317-76658(+)
MWRILQQDVPEDYVLSTGEDHSVREFVELAFSYVGIEINWEGEGVDEIGKDRKTGKLLVEVSPKYFRPTEVEQLLGNCSKAKKNLGWTPSCTFKELVEEMVESDLAEVKKGYK